MGIDICSICGQEIGMGELFWTLPDGKYESTCCRRWKNCPDDMPEWAKNSNYVRHGGVNGFGYPVGSPPINRIDDSAHDDYEEYMAEAYDLAHAIRT